ncbi:MAG: oligosaccharide flippase family protein [Solirubrobacteraceae bacterium]
MSSVDSGVAPAASSEDAAADLLDTAEAGGRALRGSTLRIIGYVSSILLALIAVPLLIQHLGNAGYGRYMVVIALVTVIAGLTEGGLNATAVRAYTTTSGGERRQLIRDALGVRIVVTGAGGCLAVAFALVAGYGEPLVIGTALAGFGMLMQLIQALYAVSLESELRLGWLAATELIRQTVNVALIVGLVLAGAGVVLLLAVAIPASATSLCVTAWLVRGRISLRPSFSSRSAWWPLVRESIPWAAVSAAYVLYFRLAIILMSLLATPNQTGYFATSLRVIEALVGVPAVAAAAAYPILTRSAHGNRDRFAAASERMFELALVLGTWMAVCLEIGAGFIVHVLAQNQADPAIAALRIQGPAVIATFLGVACVYPLLTLRRFRNAMGANLIALVVSGALTAALVGPLGARGAALAALAAETAMAVIVIASLKRAVPAVRISARTIAVVAIAGGTATAVGLLLPIEAVLAAIVGSCVYFATLTAFGRLPPEARELLAARLHLLARLRPTSR